jgi:hypothetical protein
MVKLQEADNPIITAYEVYARRPYDSDLLVTAIETHQALLRRAPRLVAADAAFYSAKNEAAAKTKGVTRVCIPNRSTKSPVRGQARLIRGSRVWIICGAFMVLAPCPVHLRSLPTGRAAIRAAVRSNGPIRALCAPPHLLENRKIE